MADFSFGGTTGREEKMTPYCWWVLFVGAASWLFDCMDQRIFVLSRTPALKTLMGSTLEGLSPEKANVVLNEHGAYVTAAMMVGWAVGGLFFGIIGDKWGRVRTLSTSIFVYSIFTGLSGLSVTWVDFTFWRFLMGCGIGGAFATAATLIAETMPSRYRALALGSFQALSATGNILGSAVARILTPDISHSVLGQEIAGWRILFAIGILPAFLIFLVIKTVREPPSWHAARASAKEQLDRQLGDLRGLLRHARWRKNAIVGVLLSVAGVVGLWGVGFWTPELVEDALPDADPGHVGKVKAWALLLQDCGALLGMFAFTGMALWLGRKLSFAVCFILGYIVVTFVFLSLRTEADAYLMTPLVGFATLSVFGGYALYFPELFPTRLRATGTAICYNVGRILSAVFILFGAPLQHAALKALGKHREFLESLGITSPFRAVAIVMCAIYVIGLVALIWAPETKGKPLPTDDDTD
jgi:MFS family permease